MSGTPNTILLEVNGVHRPIDASSKTKAGAAITPGELLAFNASDLLIPHGTAAGGGVQKLFASENPFEEPSGTAAIDTDYAINDSVQLIRAQPGDLVYAWLADGENAAKGNALVSDGAGALAVATLDATLVAGAIVGYADEDLNNSAGGARARLRVRVA